MLVIKPRYCYSVEWNVEAIAWELKYLRVESAHRNKGYGTKIMNDIIKKYGSNVIMLYAYPLYDDINFYRLVNFYKKFGFEHWNESANGSLLMRRYPVQRSETK